MGLFDKYSNVRPWLVDGGSKSGSGCWGKELSVGDMLYVEDLMVKKEVCVSLFPLTLSDIDGLHFLIMIVQETWCRLVAPPKNIEFCSYGVQRPCFLLANTNWIYGWQG